MKPTPAKPVIRYGIVDKKGHLITGLHSRKHPLEVLLEHSITPGDRIATFKCTEDPVSTREGRKLDLA